MSFRNIFVLAAFLFVSSMNCAHAAGVPMQDPNAEGSVFVLQTTDAPLPSAVMAQAKGLETSLSKHYPTKVHIFFPGYPGDKFNVEYVVGRVLPQWEAWKSAHLHSTFVVCSRHPSWCRVFVPEEVQKSAQAYQEGLSFARLSENFFGTLGDVLANINSDIATEDTSLQACLGREKARAVDDNVAAEAAVALATQGRNQALDYLGKKREHLQALVDARPACCWRELSLADGLLQGPTPSETEAIYVLASSFDAKEWEVRGKLQAESDRRFMLIGICVAALFVFAGGWILWSGFSLTLRSKVREQILHLQGEVEGWQGDLAKYQGLTKDKVGPLMAELASLLQYLSGATANYLTFGLERQGFIFPVYCWVILRQIRAIGSRLTQIRSDWDPITGQIAAALKLSIRFQARWPEGHGEIYQRVLAKYWHHFSEDRVKNALLPLQKLDPLSVLTQLLELRQKQVELSSKFEQLKMLFSSLNEKEAVRQQALTLQVYRLVLAMEDPLDEVLRVLREGLSQRP